MVNFRVVRLEEDYLLRGVKQLVEAIARALGLPRAEDGLTALREGCGASLGIELDVLLMLDVDSALDLLGTKERGMAFEQVLRALATLERRAGREHDALAHELHADDVHAALETSNQVSAT